MNRVPKDMPRHPSSSRGFTLLELIGTLVLIGLMAAVVVPRLAIRDQSVHGQAAALKGHLRYAQLNAMKRAQVWGVSCDGSQYWVFNGTDETAASSRFILPGEDADAVTLSDKNISLGSFTVFFDRYGRPYSAYADSSSNTPLAADLSISMDSSPPSTAQTITVVQETGYVP